MDRRSFRSLLARRPDFGYPLDMLLIFAEELKEYIRRNLEGVVYEDDLLYSNVREDRVFHEIKPRRESFRRPPNAAAPAGGAAKSARRPEPEPSVQKTERPLPKAQHIPPARDEDVQLCASESAPPREPEAFAGAYHKDIEAELQKQIAERSDESFSGLLLRLIDEAGMTDAQCYNRANLNRSHFNRIKNDPTYKVQKNTAIALGLALKLPRKKFDELIGRAGYSLSKANISDLIIEFFLGRGVYDIMTINRYLYEYDQPILGAGVR